jgi:hypothetical protein
MSKELRKYQPGDPINRGMYQALSDGAVETIRGPGVRHGHNTLSINPPDRPRFGNAVTVYVAAPHQVSSDDVGGLYDGTMMWPTANTDPTSTDPMELPSGMTPDPSGSVPTDCLIQYLPENGLDQNNLVTPSYQVGVIAGATSDGRWIVNVGAAAGIFRLKLTKTSGNAGNQSGPCRFLYTVKDVADNVLDTGVDPTATPHMWKRSAYGTYIDATWAIAEGSPTSGNYTIICIGETQQEGPP